MLVAPYNPDWTAQRKVWGHVPGHHLDAGLAEACVPGQALSGPDVRVLVPPEGRLQLLQLRWTEGSAVAAPGVLVASLPLRRKPWSPHSCTREVPVGLSTHVCGRAGGKGEVAAQRTPIHSGDPGVPSVQRPHAASMCFAP